MFLFLARLSKFFLNPENQIFFGATFLLLWLWPSPSPRAGRKFARGRKLAGQLSLAWILILFSPLGTIALGPLERAYPVPKPEQLRGKTALVLGGNTVLFDERSAQMLWGADGGRVQEPLRLYRLGLVTRLVITAGSINGPAQGFLGEAASVAKWWQEMGVPREAIVIEETARNTRENFERSRPLLHPGEEIVLFTSAYHMLRSMAVARATLGGSVVPYPVDFKTGELDWCSWENVINAKRVLFEVVGYLAYRVAGFSS